PIIISTYFSKKNIRQALFRLITIFILYYEKLAKVDFCIMQQIQRVKTLANSSLEMGQHKIVWQGDNDYGKRVSSGIYLYRLTVNGRQVAVKKCLMLK
ncbi:MAG: hypothetical protein PHR06_11645, partial [Candidatus Cloacimonetes bacterium]|nr:hypothetical protein [Candidatus Cloacimonadota bacterium]